MLSSHDLINNIRTRFQLSFDGFQSHLDDCDTQEQKQTEQYC